MKTNSRISRPWAGFLLPHNQRAAVALAALLLDQLLGELPNRLHPVAWLGRFAHTLETRLRARLPSSPVGDIAAGAVALLGVLGVAVGAARGIERLPPPLRTIAEIAALKQALAARALDEAVAAVENALLDDDLPRARHLLGWHLVSRETDTLTATEVAMATVESLAENLSDGVLAPLTWYLLGGLPAAWGYRAANTADAMWGYRTPRYEWFGKPAARLDDLLNLLPSRLTALLLVLVSGRPRHTWRTWRREARHTPSPNAGHPMAAMAGALHTTLSKRGAYTLHGGDTPCDTGHIRRARMLAGRARGVAMLLILLSAVVKRLKNGG